MGIQGLAALLCFLLFSSDVSPHQISISTCVDDGQVVKRNDTCKYSCAVDWLEPGDSIVIGKTHLRHYALSGIMTDISSDLPYYSSKDGLYFLLERYADRYSGNNHESGNAVTLTISDILPGDSGFFYCSVRDKIGIVKNRTSEIQIPVYGTIVEPFFARQTLYHQIVEIYKDGDEVTLLLDQLISFAFMVNVTDTMPVKPSADIKLSYIEVSEDEKDITENFVKAAREVRNTVDSNTVIMINAFTREVFDKPPTTLIDVTQGKPKLTGSYNYAHYKYTSSVTLNLIFEPQQLVCEDFVTTEVGESVTVTCQYYANPSGSFVLVLPDGGVVNNSIIPDERFEFVVTPDPQISHRYKLSLTYKYVTSQFFGQHTLRVANDYGQSSFTYQMSDAKEYRVFIRTCVNDGKSIKSGDSCEISCTATGLKSSDVFAIAKDYILHHELGNTQEIEGPYITIDSDSGLPEPLNDTGRYFGEMETIRPDVVQKATVKISDIIPGDSGGYVCYISNATQVVATSDEAYIPVHGAKVEPFFGKKSDSKNLIIKELYSDGQHIDIPKEDLVNLIFIVKVTGVMPVQPSASIVAVYEAGEPESVISTFRYGSQDNDLQVDPNSGIASHAYVQENFYQPEPNFLKISQGRPHMVGRYFYGDDEYRTDLVVNILFKPENLMCSEPLPVNAYERLLVTCSYIANPPVETIYLTLPNGHVINGTHPEEGVTFFIKFDPVPWHYTLEITYETVPNNFFGKHDLSVGNDCGSLDTEFEVVDLSQFSVATTSCMDDGAVIERGGFCEYSCRVKGLPSQYYFSIAKEFIEHWSLTSRWISFGPYITYSSTDGLHPLLQNGRYKAIKDHDELGVTLNITDLFPGDTGRYVCIINNSEGKQVLRSNQTFVPVFGADISASLSPTGHELNMTREDVAYLAFNVTLSDMMPVQPVVELVAFYPDVGITEDLSRQFTLTNKNPYVETNPAGLMYVLEEYKYIVQNPNFIKTNQGKPQIRGSYAYANYKYPSEVTINLLFAPEISCDRFPLSDVIPITVKCQFSANPGVDTFLLKMSDGTYVNLPSGSNHDIEFTVTPTGVEWLHNITLELQPTIKGIYGRNSLAVKNEYGEEEAEFTIYERPPTTPSAANFVEFPFFTCIASIVIIAVTKMLEI